MSQYYYAVASLPMLFYETDKAPEIEDFLTLAREQLTAADYQLLLAAGSPLQEPSKAPCALLQSWRGWESALRNELVRLRAKRKGEEAEPHLVEAPEIVGLEEVARSAFTQDSPLAAEEVLNRARWNYLDELEVGHYFDLERLILYYLRLRLLRRKALFERRRGRERFEHVYGHIMAPVHGIRREQS